MSPTPGPVPYGQWNSGSTAGSFNFSINANPSVPWYLGGAGGAPTTPPAPTPVASGSTRSTEFAGEELEFVAGSLTGVRCFKITPEGWLESLMYPVTWTPGENWAICMRAFNGGGKLEPADMGPDCACGFYAYWDGSNDYGSHGTVNAVVEGYGVVNIGTKGFRAQKARLLALHVARPTAESLLDSFMGLGSSVLHQPIEAIYSALTERWRTPRQRLATNYPDIPRFSTFEEMIDAFPAARGEGQRIENHPSGPVPPDNPPPII